MNNVDNKSMHSVDGKALAPWARDQIKEAGEFSVKYLANVYCTLVFAFVGFGYGHAGAGKILTEKTRYGAKKYLASMDHARKFGSGRFNALIAQLQVNGLVEIDEHDLLNLFVPAALVSFQEANPTEKLVNALVIKLVKSIDRETVQGVSGEIDMARLTEAVYKVCQTLHPATSGSSLSRESLRDYLEQSAQNNGWSDLYC